MHGIQFCDDYKTVTNQKYFIKTLEQPTTPTAATSTNLTPMRNTLVETLPLSVQAKIYTCISNILNLFKPHQ